MKQLVIFTFLAVFFITSGCRKSSNDGIVPPKDTPSFFTETSKNTIRGFVIDATNQKVADATVRIGQYVTVTDAKGEFSFTGITCSKNAASVQVEKVGYMKGYKTLALNDSAINFTSVYLWKRPNAIQFDATKDFVNNTNEYQFHIPANSLVNKKTNKPYTGSVKCTIVPMLADSSNIYYTMPGGTIGKNDKGAPQLLKTFGMLDVELTDVDGNPLQIATGSTADFSLQIPAKELATCSSFIPMWYIDKNTGIWTQEGLAFKEGDRYKATVKHFTPWNFDYGLTWNNIIGITVFDSLVQSNCPYCRIDVTDVLGITQTQYTNSFGQANFVIIASGTYTINLYDKCNVSLYTTTLNINLSNASAYSVAIPAQNSNSIKISGLAVDCNNGIITNGYCKLNRGFGDEFFSFDTVLGGFNIIFSTCDVGQVYNATFCDLNKYNKYSTTITVLNSNTNIGTLTLCTPIQYHKLEYYSGGALVGSAYTSDINANFSETFSSANEVILISSFYEPPTDKSINLHLDTNLVNGQRFIKMISSYYRNLNLPIGSGPLFDCSNSIPIQMIQNNNNPIGFYEFSFGSQLLPLGQIYSLYSPITVDSVYGYFRHQL
jgi:hypothetical protein